MVLSFVLIHKIGDTLANLTLRLLFDDLGFSNEEIAFMMSVLDLLPFSSEFLLAASCMCA